MIAHTALFFLCWMAVLGTAGAADPPPDVKSVGERVPDERPVDYLRDVKPLLARRCTSCHGALRQKSGLRVDAAELLRKGGDAGPAIVPGKPEDSLLIDAITERNGFPLMPKEGGRLSAEEIAILERWIAQGAPAPDNEPVAADPRAHWAFRTPERPPVPALAGTRLRNPVDAFIAAEWQRRELAPVGDAPPAILLRRVYLDLIGLPPAVDELREFLADDSPAALEKVVDRLLASPHYGERWGRHWMDVWRYSDWYGYGNELRNSARHIWRWRDWIVESLNADKPYDQMVLEMLAADEIAPLDVDALRATGYLARSYFKFNRDTWLDDTIEHTGKAFLGLTINCARCHDHMYDPVSQREYYQFRAIFEPYQVRTDRVPGQPDVMQDGLPRVYDANLEAPTFLYERGNDKYPDKDNPLSAGVPQAVAGDASFQVEPVSLPARAWYPGIAEFVHAEELAAARATLDARQAELAQSTTALDQARQRWQELSARVNQPVSAPRPGETAAIPAGTESGIASALDAAQITLRDAETAAAVARSAVTAAERTLESVAARIAADRARFADDRSLPPGGTGGPTANAEELSRTAARTGAEASLRQSEAEVSAAELEIARAEQKKPKDGSPNAKAIAQAKTRLDAARKRLEETRKAAQQPPEDYKPFSDTYPQTSSGRRLALARWVVDDRNPLTARVAVNQIWLRHYGEPLVTSVFDFGRNGSPPSHPELLDWLAVEFLGQEAGGRGPGAGGRNREQRTTDNGPVTTETSTLRRSATRYSQPWSFKRLHRLLVTSAAYRMDSAAPADHPGWTRDPENRRIWRMNSRRMEAEVVRDGVLAAAGQLDRRMGGADMDAGQAESVPRRSLYFRHAPEKHVQFLAMFDSASTHECYRRAETVVPQQALAMANSRLTREQSRRLAQQLSTERPSGETAASLQDAAAADVEFIAVAFERILCRPPGPAEVEDCARFLEEQSERHRATQDSPAEQQKTAIAPATDPRRRARENLVHVLLNHNEFITIR